MYYYVNTRYLDSWFGKRTKIFKYICSSSRPKKEKEKKKKQFLGQNWETKRK